VELVAKSAKLVPSVMKEQTIKTTNKNPLNIIANPRWRAWCHCTFNIPDLAVFLIAFMIALIIKPLT